MEADALSLTDAQPAELDYRIAQHQQDPSDVIPWSESGRAYLRNRDTPGRLRKASEDLPEARAWHDNIRPELGERFALAVEATVETLAEHSLQFPVSAAVVVCCAKS